MALLVAFSSSLSAQQKKITLEDIYGGTFRLESMDELKSLNDGKRYSVLNLNRTNGSSEVDIYAYKTGEKLASLVKSAEVPGLSRFSSYCFSPDETKLLLTTQSRKIYRRSTLGTFYVYDLNMNTARLLANHPVQEPSFSPDGNRVVYAYNNNLYLKNIQTGTVEQLTNDGRKNHVINGIADWVYEEEFKFVRAFEWSKNGDYIAYIRFDESKVPEFSMDVYGKGLYPDEQEFKYPKAGEQNAEVSLHVYNLSTGISKQVDLSSYNNYYIPRLKWTADPDVFSVQLMNRHQDVLDLVFVDARDLSSRLVLQEKDDAYVTVTDNLTFLNSNSFIWTSERSGWNHIYLYDKSGSLINQITSGPWEVTEFYGFDPKTARVYYQSTEMGSMNRDVYSISSSGKNKVRLTQKDGTNKAAFSSDFSYFINTYSNTETPDIFTLHDGLDGTPLREIKNNDELKKVVSGFMMSKKEFGTVDIHGESLNMYMIKPADFNPDKKYPVLLYQYSGPGSQKVSNTWNVNTDYWHQILVQQGVIVACVDGRGTGYKGRDFKKMTQLQLGKYEVADQIEFAKQLADLPYIDANRIGIWGWSYGGLVSANALFQGPKTFSMAISVAPVSSWRFYDTIYTERYMNTPQENPDGYDQNSPLSHVDALEGDLLLVHGSADDNVHLQNTMRLADALIRANKDFDWLVYPDDNHSIDGVNSRVHLYRKMTNFVKDHLGSPKKLTLDVKN